MSPKVDLQLFLLRHAHAGDPAAWHGEDADRPLSEKGEQQARRLGAFLAGVGFRTDALVSSPKLRARQTAELVGSAIGAAVRLDERLGRGVDPATVDAIVADAGTPARIVLSGHDPDFSELLAWLSGSDGLSMKKGSFARIDVSGPVADGRATLRWLVPPDLLDPDHG
jgi:phosphohistidine phosphatase